jgi:hypothetical protein
MLSNPGHQRYDLQVKHVMEVFDHLHPNSFYVVWMILVLDKYPDDYNHHQDIFLMI